MSNYDTWLQGPTGALDVETEVTLDEPCACGSTEALAIAGPMRGTEVVCTQCEADLTDREQFERPEPDHDWHDERYGW